MTTVRAPPVILLLLLAASAAAVALFGAQPAVAATPLRARSVSAAQTGTTPPPTEPCPAGFVSRFGICWKKCAADNECNSDDKLGQFGMCVFHSSNEGLEGSHTPAQGFCGCKAGFLLIGGKCVKQACNDCDGCDCKDKKVLAKKFPALTCHHGELECNYEEGYRWRWGVCLRRCDFCDGGDTCPPCKECEGHDGKTGAGDWDHDESGAAHAGGSAPATFDDSYGGSVTNTCGPFRRCLSGFCVCKPGFSYEFGKCVPKPEECPVVEQPPPPPPVDKCDNVHCGKFSYCHKGECFCKDGFVPKPGTKDCQPCPSGTRYNPATKTCVPTPTTCDNNLCPNVREQFVNVQSSSTSKRHPGVPDEGIYCCPTAPKERQCYYWPVHYCAVDFGIVCSIDEVPCRNEAGDAVCIDKYLYKCRDSGYGFDHWPAGQGPVREQPKPVVEEPKEDPQPEQPSGGDNAGEKPVQEQPTQEEPSTQEPAPGDATESSAGAAYAGVATVAFTVGAVVVGVLFG